MNLKSCDCLLKLRTTPNTRKHHEFGDELNIQANRINTNAFYYRYLLRLILSIVLVAVTAVAQHAQQADLVVVNANIRTMVSASGRAEALAVSGDRFIAVGTNKRIRKLIGPRTRTIDARNRLVLPGFNDSHVHFMGIGNSFSSLDIRDLRNSDELLDRIRRYARFLPEGRWILGGGWNDARFKLPDLRAIDLASPKHPLFLYSADGKSAIANSLALTNAKLMSSDGIVGGNALARVRAASPADHTRKWLEIAETATIYAASLGVTSVQDMHSDDQRAIYRELERLGKLRTRIYDCVSLPDWQRLAAETRSRGDVGFVRGGCLKGFSDGEASSVIRLNRDIPPADKAGLQIMVHAIGSVANAMVLDAFEKAARDNGPRDRRSRIEHAYNPNLADLPRFAHSDIIASMQPHLFDGGAGGHYLTLLDQRTRIAFGSDAAMTDLDPILGIAAAVNAGDESISVYEAVRAYTVGSAYAEFQEKEKGTIAPGKLADLVILSDDIFTSDKNAIRNSRVVLTIVGGRIVFER